MINTYIRYGIDSDLAEKLQELNLPKTTLEKTSKKNLREKYGLSNSEIDIVKDSIRRKPIDEEVIDELLSNSNYTCCLCKGKKGSSFIIHHIEEYSISQNNEYHNLAVLCPNDHDLAHKTGKSLTLKVSKEQILKEKAKWEKQVKDYNIEKSSKDGNIHEVDFIHVPRIIELYIQLFNRSPESKYSEALKSQQLITSTGFINDIKIRELNKKAETPLIFFALDGSTMLIMHFFEVFKEVIRHLNFVDLDTLLTRTEVKKGLVGKYCYYVGGLYSTSLPDEISESNPMKFFFKRKNFVVEWLVDPSYFCSSSAKWRTSHKCSYMIYGKIRNINIQEIDGKNQILIDIRPYCFGLPLLTKDRTPSIAFKKKIDLLFNQEEE